MSKQDLFFEKYVGFFANSLFGAQRMVDKFVGEIRIKHFSYVDRTPHGVIYGLNDGRIISPYEAKDGGCIIRLDTAYIHPEVPNKYIDNVLSQIATKIIQYDPDENSR